MASSADLALPETVAILPETSPIGTAVAYAAAGAQSLAEGSVTVVASAATTATDAVSSAGRAVVTAADTVGETLVPAAYVRTDRPNGEVDRLIEKYAAVYELPVSFVRHVVKRESNFNPSAYSRGHWGLMQIKHATARGMGYDGPPKGLLNPETNLKYAVKYLRGAYLVADGNVKQADWYYRTGYYYDAKRRGLLDETGLGKDRVRKRGSI